MSIEQGGGLAEEQAEAEKFNAMVTDHKITAAEASRIEKDKTPEEVEEHRKKYIEKYSQFTDRGLDIYCNEFGFKPEDLAQKRILDVGSGRRETFSKEARRYGAEVFSISPALRKWYPRQLARGLIIPDRRWQGRSVAARGQNIPFVDNAFDLITASWSVTEYTYSDYGKELKRCLEEMWRVLKSGGKMYLTPVVSNKERINEFIGDHRDEIEILRNDTDVTIIAKKEVETE